MRRRVIGAILCLIVIASNAAAIYAEASDQDLLATLHLEVSYFSLDTTDDFADVVYPDGIVNGSPQRKIVPELSLGFKVRIGNLIAKTSWTPQRSVPRFPPHQHLYRYQEVFRI